VDKLLNALGNKGLRPICVNFFGLWKSGDIRAQRLPGKVRIGKVLDADGIRLDFAAR
jgi:hypothetical protein